MQTAMMVVNTLKELNIISISFRIVLAVICGGVIGAGERISQRECEPICWCASDRHLLCRQDSICIIPLKQEIRLDLAHR